ncbi:MAG: DUF4129 domain-containing protein [Anaerolineae bacterium]
MSERNWPEAVFHLLVIAAMISCIVLSLAEFLHILLPDLHSIALLACAALGSLEAGFSYHILRRGRSLGGMNIIRFRVIELALLLIPVKVVTFLGRPWDAVLAEIRGWPQAPLSFLDINTIFAYLALVIAWETTTLTLRDLERVGDPRHHDDRRPTPLADLTTRFFWGGVALMILVGANQVRFSALLDFQRPSIPGIVVNAMVYFGLGLVMLGQVHFARLRKRWQADDVPVDRDLVGGWARYALIFAALAILLALLLPTRYALGFLEVAGAVLEFLGALIWFFFYLLSLPLLWLFTMLTRNRAPPDQEPPLVDHLPELPQPRPGGIAGDSLGWLEVARSVLFWAVLVGAVVYLVRSYLADRPELMEMIRGIRPLAVVWSWLGALWRRLTGWVEAVGERLPRRRVRRRERDRPSGAPSRLFRPGARSPRQRILFYYLSLLRHAAEQGVPRRSTQTPYEYTASLIPHVPQAEEDVGQLTEAFVEARYSQHEIDRGHAGIVRAAWRRIREALRRPSG